MTKRAPLCGFLRDRTSKSIELFLAASLTLALGACNSTTSNNPAAPESPTPHASATHSGGEGGEGGEGGVVESDTDYLTALGLMKGHLIVAKELIEAGKVAEAEPHIEHPIEELYGTIESELSKRQVPPFKTTLNQLHDSVKAKADKGKISSEYDAAMKAIDGAIANIPAAQRQDPNFVLKAISGMLKTASDEYGAAIADGKIQELIEYQDARGFVLYSESLYKTVRDKVSQTKPDVDKTIAANLEALEKNLPSAQTPPATLKTAAEFSSIVEKIPNSL